MASTCTYVHTTLLPACFYIIFLAEICIIIIIIIIILIIIIITILIIIIIILINFIIFIIINGLVSLIKTIITRREWRMSRGKGLEVLRRE